MQLNCETNLTLSHETGNDLLSGCSNGDDSFAFIPVSVAEPLSASLESVSSLSLSAPLSMTRW